MIGVNVDNNDVSDDRDDEVKERKKFDDKYEIWLEDELPMNLNNKAWAGNLFSIVINKYKMLVAIYVAVMVLVGIIGSVAMWFVQSHWSGLAQNPFPYWTLGMMVWIWSPVGIPAIYSLFLTKPAWIIRLSEENSFFNDSQKWFKKDYGEFNLNEGKYDGGNSRYLWLWEYEKGKYRNFAWDDVTISQSKIGSNPPNSADMAGIVSYKETMAKYAAKSALTKQQIVQYSAFIIIIVAELAAALFFQGRLADTA